GTISLVDFFGYQQPIRGTVSGSVTNDGRLLLSGGSDAISAPLGASFQFSIGGWNTILSANTLPLAHDPAMTGGWDQSLVAIGADGHAFTRQTIVWADQTTPEPPPVNSPQADAIRGRF